MSFTYSFDAIIQTLPSVRMPYRDKADAEGNPVAGCSCVALLTRA